MADDFRWQGYTHKELHDLINSGPGPISSATAATRWSALSSALAEINDELLHGVSDSTESWAGAAAEATRHGISPLAKWADDMQGSAQKMRVVAEQQADSIAKARANMPPVIEAAATSPSPGLFGAVVDFVDAEILEGLRDSFAKQAINVMSTYQNDTKNNVSGFGQFPLPPQVV